MSRRATGVQLRPLDLTDIHILIVDDYEDTLELFRVGLQAFGAKVLTARTARDALAIIKTVRVNAMVWILRCPARTDSGSSSNSADSSPSRAAVSRRSPSRRTGTATQANGSPISVSRHSSRNPLTPSTSPERSRSSSGADQRPRIYGRPSADRALLPSG